MAKYIKTAQKSVESAMKRKEKGTLRSGKSAKKVVDKKQAIAIGLSEAKKKGVKVPDKKVAAPKKAATKKAATKKAATKKGTPKNLPVKKAATKKSSTSKSTARKAISSKTPVKKSTLKKTVSKLLSSNNTVSEKRSVTKNKGGDFNSSSDLIPEKNKDDQLPVKKDDMEFAPAAEDPVKITDQKIYNKVTSRVDPKHNMAISSTPKGGIKPSGKKPLW